MSSETIENLSETISNLKKEAEGLRAHTDFITQLDSVGKEVTEQAQMVMATNIKVQRLSLSLVSLSKSLSEALKSINISSEVVATSIKAEVEKILVDGLSHQSIQINALMAAYTELAESQMKQIQSHTKKLDSLESSHLAILSSLDSLGKKVDAQIELSERRFFNQMFKS